MDTLGAPVVPGWGAAQRLEATDFATSLKLTSSLTANLVNEALHFAAERFGILCHRGGNA